MRFVTACVLSAAVLAVQLDTPWRLAILLGFAAGFVRESFVLVLPFAFFHTLKRHDLKRAVIRTTAIAAAFFVVSLTLRAIITPIAPDDWWSGVVDSMGFRARHFWDKQWYVLTIGTWGVFVPLALADFKGLARRLRENLDLTILVATPTFLQIYLRHLKNQGFLVPEDCFTMSCELHSGDFLRYGKGEILVRAAT